MKLCGNCIKTISFATEEKPYRCDVCGNKRFSQTSMSPRLCDVCAVGKSQCMICLDKIGTSTNIAKDIMDDKFKNDEFFSKIVGVTFEERQDRISKLVSGQELFFLHDKQNEYDPNAIKLFSDKERLIELGFIKKEITPDLLEYMYTHNVRFGVFVSEVTGGADKKSFGCNIKIKLYR
jgi:hypothetical protein